jgi:hypothetical protein
MHIIVSMQADGLIIATNMQGHILAECFFKAEDETAEELRQMGYARLLYTYAAATVEAGPGLEPTDLEDVFIEGTPPAAQCSSPTEERVTTTQGMRSSGTGMEGL